MVSIPDIIQTIKKASNSKVYYKKFFEKVLGETEFVALNENNSKSLVIVKRSREAKTDWEPTPSRAAAFYEGRRDILLGLKRFFQPSGICGEQDSFPGKQDDIYVALINLFADAEITELLPCFYCFTATSSLKCVYATYALYMAALKHAAQTQLDIDTFKTELFDTIRMEESIIKRNNVNITIINKAVLRTEEEEWQKQRNLNAPSARTASQEILDGFAEVDHRQKMAAPFTKEEEKLFGVLTVLKNLSLERVSLCLLGQILPMTLSQLESVLTARGLAVEGDCVYMNGEIPCGDVAGAEALFTEWCKVEPTKSITSVLDYEAACVKFWAFRSLTYLAREHSRLSMDFFLELQYEAYVRSDVALAEAVYQHIAMLQDVLNSDASRSVFRKADLVNAEMKILLSLDDAKEAYDAYSLDSPKHQALKKEAPALWANCVENLAYINKDAAFGLQILTDAEEELRATEDFQDKVKTLLNLAYHQGIMKYRLRRYAEAAEQLEQTLKSAKFLAPETALLIPTTLAWSKWRNAQQAGENLKVAAEASLAIFKQSLSDRMAFYGEKNHYVAHTYSQTAKLLLEAARDKVYPELPAEAITFAEKALEIAKEVLGDSAENTLQYSKLCCDIRAFKEQE